MSYNALPTVLKAHRHHRKQSPQPNTARPLGGLYSSCSLSSPLLTQQDLNSSYLPLNTYPAAECNVTPQPCQLLKGNHVKCCQLRAGSWGHHDLSTGTQQAETRVLPASKKLKSTSFKCHWDLVTLHYLIASKISNAQGIFAATAYGKKLHQCSSTTRNTQQTRNAKPAKNTAILLLDFPISLSNRII